MFERLKKALQPSDERQQRKELIRTLAAAQAYHRAISQHVGPDNQSSYPEEMRRELVEKLSLNWLQDYARKVFPNIDEFEVEEGWVIKHPDHLEREEHQRFTLHHLSSWIDAQRNSLGV